MEDLLSHVKSVTGGVQISDDKITLNVGGVKYETTRSALTAYPSATLGKMFSPENETLLKPAYPGGNEYFIDRNGHAFYFIMEFYRTGEITWNEDISSSKEFPVTKRALDLEIEYFQIPLAEKRAERNLQKTVTIIDELISSLETLINEAMSRYVTEVDFGFYLCGSFQWQNPFVADRWFDKFAKTGYGILSNDKISGKIMTRIKEKFPTLKYEIEKSNSAWGALITVKFSGICNIDDMEDFI